MIRLVGGLPGSGKSYYAANFIAKFGKYDELYKTFVLTKDVKVFTNLDDLQIEHTSLEHCYQKYGGANKFFTVENFTKIRDHFPKSHLLVIIDEAQRTIDDDLLKDKDVAFFFQYHRHLGVDIFLLTNDIASCSRKVVGLCEFIIEAQPRSRSLPTVFRYKFKDTKGTNLYSQTVKQKQEVFSIYKSFTTDEKEKPKNVLWHWVVMAFIAIVLSTVGFKTFVHAFTHRTNSVVGRDGKMTSKAAVDAAKPSFKAQSTAKLAPVVAPVPAAAPAPHESKPPRVRRVRPGRAEDKLAVPLPKLNSSGSTVDVVPVPAPVGWVMGKPKGVIEVNQHKYFSVNGRLLDSSDCKKADIAGMLLCKQDAVALNE